MSRYCIQIDLDECIGYGRCAELASSHFRLDGGRATVLVSETDDPAVLDAESECATSAIRVTEL